MSPWLILMFILVTAYALLQLLGSWLLYLWARPPAQPPPPSPNLSVDVFVTTCREPYELVKRALAAACAMRGVHRTWLLDDGRDPALAHLATEMGAHYIVRSGNENAKAGNINAALAQTTGDIIAVFDIDHVPAPNFLQRTLGHFANPAVGFVQVMVSFCNSTESWIARAAAETSYDFYNPTSFGMEAVGGTTMMGSNALIRRRALVSIGGYRPGLAEDLATSIALHAAGWQSAYVAEPLAPGLAPPDLSAWFTQQLKWARGVFELLLTAYPRLFAYLTMGQRLSYAVRMTKYLIGPIVSIHLVLTIVSLFTGENVRGGFQQYLLHLFPVVLFDMLIRQTAMSMWRHPSTPTTSLWRAVVLVLVTWPIYTLAWIMALLRFPLEFRLTPKQSSGRINPVWLLPQLIALLSLCTGLLVFLSTASHSFSLWILLFAISLAIPHFVLAYIFGRILRRTTS